MKVELGGNVQLSLEKIGQVGRFLGCGLVAGKKNEGKMGEMSSCLHT